MSGKPKQEPTLPPGFFGAIRIGDTVWTRHEVTAIEHGRPVTRWETVASPARDELRSQCANWMEDPRLPGLALEGFRQAVQEAKRKSDEAEAK